jgi:hypothetical protein
MDLLQREGPVARQASGPVWIDPPKYWAAIQGKTDEEIDQLWNEILQLLQEGKSDLVSQIEFVTCIGYPFKGKQLSSVA